MHSAENTIWFNSCRIS